ncbi:ribulose-phosphate 3-epimerase [Leucobacter chromiiresistens]|uniref:Pentose-5-phosphate-3-epimerase n=1 Tax=Leucobacter chromiiresistens TaxID=1079994 RepID=A0A1H0XRZ3_9MICO|nr:ribulose-phosphate 3-epimerase [Leucobacter chromiiresistens]SDQ05551.1 Pentose-5-phosphate-3-epimerase [Leucobacter chromiiresistens]
MTAPQLAARDAVRALPNAGWIGELPEGAVYGSLYAAPQGEREAAADRFADAGLPMHLDVILDRDAHGEPAHRGITIAELRACGARHPDSLLEVHLIVLTGAQHGAGPEFASRLRAEIAAVLEVAAAIGAQRAALPVDIASDAALTEAFRAAGGEVWTVLAPGDDPAPLRADATGALIMLIEPGTRDAARPELLDRIPRLAPNVQVGVDGGVDAAIARRAIALGAHHVVVGRALLDPEPPEAVRGEQP